MVLICTPDLPRRPTATSRLPLSALGFIRTFWEFFDAKSEFRTSLTADLLAGLTVSGEAALASALVR